MELLYHLLPDKTNLQLETWDLDEAQASFKLILSSMQALVKCPVCDKQTHRIHSRYERTLTDLPWADYNITLQLRVRKFFCINTLCKRRIFTERLASVTAPWARRTRRLAQRLTDIGLALGGAAGVRLSQRLGFSVSRNTLLSLVRKIPLPSVGLLSKVGVDDFCFRKGQTYGTIVVDLERSRPVRLLSDRSAETLAEWLKDYPDIKIVSRDRALAYAKGIRQGAPDAIQVADRFHLLQNLAETLYQVFGMHGKAIKVVEETHTQRETIRPDGTVVGPVLPPIPTTQQQDLASKRRTRRKALYQQVWDLHSNGWSAPAIAKLVGIGRTTVFRYLRTPTFPERQGRSDSGIRSLVSPYKDYLVKRWNEGCDEALQLFEEIQPLGYLGSYDTVARYVRRLRSSVGIKTQQWYSIKSLPKVIESEKLSLTPRRATWLVLRPKESRIEVDEKLIVLLRTQHSDIAEAMELASGFAQLVRQRQPEQLDSWLAQADCSTLSPFRRFAQSLRQDYDAVKAGVTISVSNGPVEGHINRLKMLKRQMYGRAKIDLLERRFLLAT